MRRSKHGLSVTDRIRGRSGQAVLEFALAVPFVALLIVGMTDFARAFLHYQVVTDSARAGARRASLGSQHLSPDSIYDVVRNALEGGGIDVSTATLPEEELCEVPTENVTVVTIYSCGWATQTSGEPVRVGIAVPYEFSFLGPFVGWTTGNRQITIKTSIVMRKE